jgi:hydrogenase expression/formation protein HypD
MLRVPGSSAANLLTVRAGGADVRLLTSPLQALELALAHPRRQVVFLAVGFETTAPATALLAHRTLALGLANLSILTAHVRVAPAMETLLEPDRSDGTPTEVQGFLAAGHVCSVVGTGELRELVTNRGLPVVVTGFEPVDLLRGVVTCVRLLEQGAPRLENAYPQVVREEGNPAARALLAEVFAVVDQPWRGFGVVRGGGLALRGPWAALEARRRFGLPEPHDHPTASSSLPGCPSCPPAGAAGPIDGPINGPAADPCIAAAILRGRALPTQCTAFGSTCTPEHPLGAPMVSSEGVCAAYQRYRSAPTAP